MPVIVCENKDCKHISKRRTRVVDYSGCKVLRHTCKAKIVNMTALSCDDVGMVDILGYQPYECVGGRKYHD